MSDGRIRQLERQAALGDTEAEARLLAERVRIGASSWEKVQLLAVLGHMPAVIACDVWEPIFSPALEPYQWLQAAEVKATCTLTIPTSATAESPRWGIAEGIVGRDQATKTIVHLADVDLSEFATVGNEEQRVELNRRMVYQILGSKMQPKLYKRGTLPGMDVAACLGYFSQEVMVRAARVVAHFVLCHWEEGISHQPDGFALEGLTATHPKTGAIEQIPANGDFLSAAGMRRLGIPREPRQLLWLIDEWVDESAEVGPGSHLFDTPREATIEAIIDSALVDEVQELQDRETQYPVAPGPFAVLEAVMLIMGAGFVSPRADEDDVHPSLILARLWAQGLDAVRTDGDTPPSRVDQWLLKEVLRPALMKWAGAD